MNKNLIGLRQIRTGELYGFVTGLMDPIIDTQISGLNSLIIAVSGDLQSQIDLISTSGGGGGGTGNLNTRSFNIASGAEFVLCPFGVTSTGKVTFSLGSSGAGDPILGAGITIASNTGVRIDFTDSTFSDKYYVNLHF